MRLASDLTSNLHAAIRWKDSGWELRDLGSLNGTYVDDEPIESGGRRPLAVGTRIAFGDRLDVFEMTDDTPPVAVATAPDGRAVVAKNGFLLLPDDESPVYQVFHDAADRWVAESTEGPRQPLLDGGTLQIGNEIWM
ncbi:MAG TPA: FHA domain-containing protein, partial [Haliangium sp.]|nr:FHA domain-containing protein [Haliangium sp.]